MSRAYGSLVLLVVLINKLKFVVGRLSEALPLASYSQSGPACQLVHIGLLVEHVPLY
ncbi:hypothetical protein [Niabella beijingensis]|uniref:hypothetical protein n=1 Tax=Niabella beijingensis TaxID=2872700 RepID=UPI001CC16698|nr:hypothetical protein [Niabella beijingensis]MBZ4189621.1 hypothetical protein [Niabella beijingensis]